MIIALNGYSGSGKDLVGKMLQYFSSECSKKDSMYYRPFDRFVEAGGGSDLRNFDHHYYSEWEIKKFAGKLKEIASMLTGIPVHKFEDQEFKKTNLGPEWNHLVWNDPDPIEGNDYRITSRIQYEDDTSLITYGYGSEAEVFDHEIVSVPMTVREFLQKLGTDGLRDGLHTNVWVNALFADYTPVHTDHVEGGFEYPYWIITDCRFKNEAQAVKARGGVVIRINRPGVEAVNAHPSETGLDNWSFDFTIHNDGDISNLLERVHVLYETIMVTQ